MGFFGFFKRNPKPNNASKVQGNAGLNRSQNNTFNKNNVQGRLQKAGLIRSQSAQTNTYKTGIHFRNVNSKNKLNQFRNEKLRYYATKLGLNVSDLKRLAGALNSNNNINMLIKVRTLYQNRKNKNIK